MTFSEDSGATPAAPQPFSGDGSIFDHPDMLLTSPTTNERVVDTQSGFLLVVKRVGERLAFSCKRRVGTPPSSSIVLTPDESLKLSKILSSSTVGMDDSAEETVARPGVGGRRRFPFTPPSATRKTGGLQRLAKPLAIGGAVVLGVGLLVAGMALGTFVSPARTVSVQTDPLSTQNVDKFARTFIADMLDFNPETYKASQIQAMAHMSPELLEKYWKETNFPLGRKQLKGLPQGTTVMIERIGQEHPAAGSATADIYAQLVHSDTKLSNPVHLKLKLSAAEDGSICVLEQEDLTAAVAPPAAQDTPAGAEPAATSETTSAPATP